MPPWAKLPTGCVMFLESTKVIFWFRFLPLIYLIDDRRHLIKTYLKALAFI